MAEILQAMRTFAMLRESETNIEEGQEKEFLRGTFSIMLFDENSKEEIDELKSKFMRYKKELGGLDIEEFKAALRPLTSKGISLNQILTTYRKMDPCDEEALTWNDFMNFAIEEHNKRMSMMATKDEMPFGPDVIQLKHNHRDPIIRIGFMPTVDPITKLLDFGFGKYMVLSREGLMSVWSMRVKPLSYNNLVPKNTTDSGWYIDMVCMYHNGFICVCTTARDLIFYDYTRAGWSRKYWLKKLSHSPTCLSYWAGMAQEQMAVLLWGDTSGGIRMIEFDLSQRLPMFGIPVKEGCSELIYGDLLKCVYEGVTFRVFPNVHKDWVKEVKYIPQATSFVSCCKDDNTALYMSHVEPSKKKPCYFHVLRGFLCFDFSYELNILAAAGIDCNIWLYNPYMPQKVVAMMEGHIRPVSHIKINELENYCISVDLSRSVMIFNLSTQVCIMRVPGQAVRMGNHFIYSVYLNSYRKMCLLGSYGLCLLKRHTLEGLSVEVRSHDHKLVGALYCPVFEQVVSVCQGSMVRVWDIITGTRVMQFGMAHSKKAQGRVVPMEIECIALTENKKRLCTAAEGVIKIWNFCVGVVLRVLDMSNCQKITSIVMAKNQIFVTGWSKYINVFSDFKGEEGIKKMRNFMTISWYRFAHSQFPLYVQSWAIKHMDDCLALCILEPNLIASAAYDGSIIVWSRETTESYCKLHASFSSMPELDTAVRAADMDTTDQDDADEEQSEDAFMTIGRHLRKEGGWYRLLRALKKRQIEREKRRAALERKDFSAKYKKKKKRMNMQGLSLVYESAVEALVNLESRRPIDPQTATLVAGGAECWIRFWSLHPKGGLLGQFTSTRRKLESIRCMTTDKNNEYLITGDTMGLLRIWDIKEFCNADKLTQEERDEREKRLKKTFVYTRLPFKPEEILDTMEKLREKRISVPDASKPRKNLKSPRLLSSVRCHTQPIVSVELIDERNLILTASQDRTVRLWTKNCTYIGTFGEIWKPIPIVVGAVVEKFPRLPKDIQRCASARSLATLHNGKMPKWRTACYVVRRHIYEQRREKQLEENKAKLKAERFARGEPDSEESIDTSERYASKILGKYYMPRRRYKGPMSLEDQGFPPLVIFKGRCAPFQTTLPRPILPLEPLYRPPTFFDIDSRRPLQYKTRRQTRHMMNILNQMCGDPMRYGQNSRSQSGSSWGSTPTKRTSQALVSKSADTIDQNSYIDVDSKRNKDKTYNSSPSRFMNANTNESIPSLENLIHSQIGSSFSFTTDTNIESGALMHSPMFRRKNDVAGRLWSPRFPGEGRSILQEINSRNNPRRSDEDEEEDYNDDEYDERDHSDTYILEAVKKALSYNPYCGDSDDDEDMASLGLCRFPIEPSRNDDNVFNPFTSVVGVKLPSIDINNCSKVKSNFFIN